jgi:hypothetical protein
MPFGQSNQRTTVKRPHVKGGWLIGIRSLHLQMTAQKSRWPFLGESIRLES